MKRLILSRRQSEGVLLFVPGLAEPIRVSVSKTGTHTKLCFEADRSVSIVREEIVRETEPANGR